MITFVTAGALDAPVGYRVFVTIGALVFLPLVPLAFRLHWRDKIRVFDEPFGFWPYSDALWRGWVRAMPAMSSAMVAILALVLYGLYGPEDRHALLAVLVVTLGFAALAFLAGVSAILVNRPKFVVPPHLRNQPGTLAEWWAGWQRWRARRAADRASGPG